MDGLSRWERQKLTFPARGKFGECTSDLLRSDVKLLLMLTLVTPQRALGSMVLSTLDFLGSLVMLLLTLTMVVPRQALGSIRRSWEVGMMTMEDECNRCFNDENGVNKVV